MTQLILMAKKTWQEKMLGTKEWKVEKTDKDFADMPKGSKMLVATPMIVEEYIRNIPKGTSTTLQQMRKDLAAEYNADYTCPITSGIFLRIVAEAAYEQMMKGKPIKSIAPFWRMIDEKSPTAKKLSFGTELLIKERKKEGIV
jgi:hypothetical protein